MTLYHIPTVYLVLSFLYILLPIAVWLALNNQKSKTILLWCAGGELLAIGLLLIGLRANVPSWISYTLANGLCWLAILIQAMALRGMLKQPSRFGYGVIAVTCWLLVFEYFRLVLENSHLRFAWALWFFIAGFAHIAQLARRISVNLGLKNARLLFVVYSAAAVVLCIRFVRVIFGYTEPDAMAQGADTFLIVVSGVLVSVLGSFAFVGMFIERASQREMLATAERVRQEEATRLGEQIAHLERQRTLGTMSYAFAHELSQPLTAILMDTQAIKSSLANHPLNVHEIHESIADVERSANRTVQLVERIRSFVRPNYGDYEDVDMKLLVRDVQHLLSYDIRNQNVQFEWDFGESDCLVNGDKIQLSQIVLNVYRNAIQAMASTDVRKISVSLDCEDQRVVLHVHDSGTGLDDAVKNQVGQPFVTTKREGLGVGLSISKTIAELHLGSLTIANAVDGGALVELNLPAVHV